MKFTIVAGIGAVGIVAAAFVWNSSAAVRRYQEPNVVHTDWIPPTTSIDASYVASAKALLGNGLADPRKGYFAHVKVQIGDAAWDPKKVTEADGWVQPDGKHAVLFDGVEYPISGIPSPAELEKAVGPPANNGNRFPIPSGIDIGPTAATLPALLLLVGRKDLAEAQFKTSQLRNPDGTNRDTRLFSFLADRYNMLTAQALMSHDDPGGLEWAKDLLLVNKVRQEQNLPEPDVNSYDQAVSLKYAKLLWADLQRRVAHPKPATIDLTSTKRLGESQRIAILIDDLDEVGGRQWGQPGGVDYEQDPVYKAIESEGPAAVPALLDALQNDKRFSRTVSFGRNFFPVRSIHTVKSVVWRLMVDLWPSAGRYQENQMAVPDVEALRKAWQTQAKLSEPERWVEVLKDDHAGERNWLAAGLFLTKPADEIHHGMSYTVSKNPNGPMTGEALHRVRMGEVSDLIAKRAIEMAQVHTNSTGDIFVCNDALRLAKAEAKWDPKHALSCLKQVCEASFATADRLGQYANPGQGFAGSLATVIAERVNANDPTAAKDYERLCSMSSPGPTFVDYNLYRPLWECPNNAEIQAIGNKTMAAWFKEIVEGPKGAGAAQQLTGTLPSTPLLTVSSYRRLLANAIESEVSAGTLELQGKDLRYKLHGGGNGGWNLPASLSDADLNSANRDLSTGDYVAQSLTICGLKGLPVFHILGSQAQRAQERRQFAEWLTDDHRNWVAVTKTSGFSTMFQ